MAVWHYIFQYGSNFATWAICLGDRHFETDGSRQIRQQNDEEAKNVVFYSSFCDSHVYCKVDPGGGALSFFAPARPWPSEMNFAKPARVH